MDFGALVFILMSTVLVNNYVLAQFLGLCPFLGVTKSVKNAAGMGFAVIFVMVLATAVTWPLQMFVLNKFGIGFMQTIVFILVIGSLVQFVEIALKKYLPPLYKSLGVFLPLITTNCAIFAVTLINIREEYGIIQSLVNALGAGLGFLLVMVILAGIRENIENADPPESFKGLPLTLVSVALLSLSFLGFSGVIENLFG
jgi:electron transport complex protein RnfA